MHESFAEALLRTASSGERAALCWRRRSTPALTVGNGPETIWSRARGWSAEWGTIGIVVGRIDAGVQRDAVAAYQSLLEGDVEPLVALLCAQVEWNEYAGRRLIETIRGRDRVADLLTSRARMLSGVSMRRLVVRRNSVDAEFSTPWWRDSSRLYLVVASIAGGAFRQTLEFSAGIDRIDNRTVLISPLIPEAETLAVMLGR